MEIERIPAARVINKGHDRSAEMGARSNSGLSVDLARAREPGRGREADTPGQIPPRGWRDILWRVFWSVSEDRILSTSGGVAFFTLLAVFPGIAAIVSLYGLFANASTIGKHLSLLSGFLPGGVLQLIAETLIFRQGNETLGTAFVVGLLIALWSANSGMAALFDALNVVYDEREKRSLVGFYATTFLFTLAGIVFVILAITGVVVLPIMLKFRRSRGDNGTAFRGPAMARPSRDHRGEPCLHLPLWPEPEGRSLALGHMGEHPRRIAVDGNIHAVLLVRRHLRHLQQNIRLPWCWRRFHGLVVDLSGDRPARRRAQRADGTPDRARHNGRRFEAPRFKRSDDGRSRRRGTNIGCAPPLVATRCPNKPSVRSSIATLGRFCGVPEF
jgi:hypothetical protein